jgi:hypothetical protein
MIYKILHRKQKIKKTQISQETGERGGGVRGVNSDAPEGEAVPAPHLAPVVLLLLLNPLISHK